MHRNIRAMRPSPATRSNQSTLSSLRDMLPSQVMPRNRRAMPNNLATTSHSKVLLSNPKAITSSHRAMLSRSSP